MNQFKAICLLAGIVWLAGVAPVASAAETTARPAIQASAFDPRDVTLLDGPFREAMLRDQAYLLSLEPDRLLHMFRVTAGLLSTAQPYGGWEAPTVEVRGHSLGHYLSACATMYVASGDERFKDRVKLIVAALAQCQDAMPQKGFHAGYLSAFPESFIDRVETLKPVWAPWYTLHKIMAGLLDAHRLCGNDQALAVAVKMADWVKFRVDHLTEAQMQAALQNEFGGMNEVLANLYGVTGNPDHLRLARAFDHKFVFDPLARGEDRLTGLHANTQVPKAIGAAREFELTGETRYRDIARFFWQQVAITRAYVIGGHSDHEYFFPVQEFSKHLSPNTAEVCNTYNMLKLTGHLFSWEPSAKLMDFYERAMFNHILASQDPQTGMFVYLTSLKPGHFKTYSTPENSFWCCVGTGMENHAKYNENIYSQGEDALYVNQILASELRWKAKGLTVRQETRFPEEDTTRLKFSAAQPVRLTVWLRHPAWATQGLSVRINNETHPFQSTPGSYVPILREWREGDVLEVRLPMALAYEAMPDDAGVVAFRYGPIVLAGRLGTDGMPEPYAKAELDQVNVPSPEVPVLIGETDSILKRIQPVSGKPLTFRMSATGKPSEIELIPFYRMHQERYSVYWNVMTREEFAARQEQRAAAEVKRREFEARIIDQVMPGFTQSETDHALAGERMESGEHQSRKWRHANEGGWISYRLKVLPGQPAELVCDYWGSDVGGRTFDILADGVKLATQTLENNRPGEFYQQSYPLTAEITKNKTFVTIRFQAQPGKRAGGLYGCRTMKPAPNGATSNTNPNAK